VEREVFSKNSGLLLLNGGDDLFERSISLLKVVVDDDTVEQIGFVFKANNTFHRNKKY